MKFGNGDTQFKATFVKIKFSEKDGMMPGWPSNFESDTYHHDASYQSQDQVQGDHRMFAPLLLQRWRMFTRWGCLEPWGNGATTGLSVCHSWRPSSQFGRL